MTMTPLTLFKCLSDDTRLRVLLLIQNQGELCVGELVEALQSSQPKVSRHLANLKSCGLLVDRKSSQWVFYRVNPELPKWANEIICQGVLASDESLKILTSHLNLVNEPNRHVACC